MTEFVTSDPHLFHSRVSELRGFSDPEDFNASWSEKWVSTAKPKDTVWILGDLTGGSLAATTQALNLLARLPGKKHLILGNHDPAHPMYRDSHNRMGMYFPTFASVQLHARRSIGGTRVLMSHMPYSGDHSETERFAQWRLPDFGVPLVHGHTHSKIALSGSTKSRACQVNVAWEAWGKLVPFESLVEMVR